MLKHTFARATSVLLGGFFTLSCLFSLTVNAADITTTELAGGVFLFQGAGSNVVAIVNDDEELLVIDGGLAENSSDLLSVIRSATGTRKINTLINTHWHPEQTGLNERAGRDGATIIAHEQTLMYLSNTVTSPLYGGLENRMEPLPERARPNLVTREGGSLEFAGHHIEYHYLPAAHTNGDLYVSIPDINVLIAGGVAGSENWPLIDYWNGAFIGGLVRGTEKLAEISNADTVVIPAHGAVEKGADLVAQREMYRQLFLDFAAMINKGMGYNDLVAINPLHAYEDRYGDAAVFTEGAFRSMSMAYVPD